MPEYRTIVVPYDFSSHADVALERAVDLARRLGAELHLVHVIQPWAYAYPVLEGPPVLAPNMAEIRATAERSLAQVADRIGPKVVGHVLEGGNIADALREAATMFGADLIVMGTHGRTGLAHVFLGSVAERTIRQAPCPVLTVRDPEGHAEGSG
jgi:nucleotide-binding universal stress UspA family protein